MNAILGGQFSSRINLNLREDKGYTYGARSSFAFRQGPGPFEAGGAGADGRDQGGARRAGQGADRRSTGPRPITDEELAFAKDRLIKGFPGGSRRPSGGRRHALPSWSSTTCPTTTSPPTRGEVEAVTKADVDRVAKKYLDPRPDGDPVVGDRSKVERPMRSLPFAKVINVLDPEGNPLPSAGDPTEGGEVREAARAYMIMVG